LQASNEAVVALILGGQWDPDDVSRRCDERVGEQKAVAESVLENQVYREVSDPGVRPHELEAPQERGGCSLLDLVSAAYEDF